jgi:cleavage stimulation factor subunit 3
MISDSKRDFQVNKISIETFIKFKFKNASKVARQYEQIVRGINRQAVSIPQRGMSMEIKQAELWRKYIQWEKSNPMNTEEYGQFARRGVFDSDN